MGTGRAMGDTIAETISRPAKRSKIDDGSQIRDEGVPGDIETAAKTELVAVQGNNEEADDEADAEDRKILEEQSAAMQALEAFQVKIRDVRNFRHSCVLIIPKAQTGISSQSFCYAFWRCTVLVLT